MNKTKKLIAPAYDKTSDYEVLKYELGLDLEEIENWEEENWLQVVKKRDSAGVKWKMISSHWKKRLWMN